MEIAVSKSKWLGVWGNDAMENLMGWGSCETVKGDFLVSFHVEKLNLRLLGGGDGSESIVWIII